MNTKTYTDKLNDAQRADFGAKTNGDFRRQIDKDITHDVIKNTDWSAESKYHNTYYNKGQYSARTIRMSNKEWHKLNTIQYDEANNIIGSTCNSID